MSEHALVALGLSAGLLGLLLGGLAGAAISRVTLWKGPAIVGAGMIGQILLALLELAGYAEIPLLGWILFIVVAGLTARWLGVGVGASAVIIIGGILGFMLSGLVVVYVLTQLTPQA